MQTFVNKLVGNDFKAPATAYVFAWCNVCFPITRPLEFLKKTIKDMRNMSWFFAVIWHTMGDLYHSRYRRSLHDCMDYERRTSLWCALERSLLCIRWIRNRHTSLAANSIPKMLPMSFLECPRFWDSLVKALFSAKIIRILSCQCMNQLRMLDETHHPILNSIFPHIEAERIGLLCWVLGHTTFCGIRCNRCARKFTRNSLVIRCREQVILCREILTSASRDLQIAERR